MYIDCVTNSGKPYLRVAESYSVVVGGVRKNRKRTVRNIGPLSRHDDGRPDFLKRLKQSFKDGSPIIDGLSDLLDGEKPRKRITVEYDVEKPDDCVCNPKNIGYFILDGLYDALDALDAKADAIQKRMNLKISKGIGRNTEVCFYDVTKEICR
jgi:hypothetical protein